MFIEIRVEGVEVFAVQAVLNQTQALTETLIVYDFTLPQVFDGIADFRIFYKTKNVVVGQTRFLLCCCLTRITGFILWCPGIFCVL